MRSIAIVCIRAIAALLILTNVSMLSVMLPTQLIVSSSEVRWYLYSGPVVMIAIGFVVLMFSKRLAVLLVAGTSPPDSSVVDGQALLQVGTLVVGLYLLGTGIPQLVGAVSQYFVLGSFHDAADLRVRIPQHSAIGSMAASLVEMAIGCLLVGMSKPVSALWRKPPPGAA